MKVYFTLTGTQFYYGEKFLEPGMKLKLEKDYLKLRTIPLMPRRDMREIRGTFAELTGSDSSRLPRRITTRKLSMIMWVVDSENLRFFINIFLIGLVCAV